jgi:hypothetical protein
MRGALRRSLVVLVASAATAGLSGPLAWADATPNNCAGLW